MEQSRNEREGETGDPRETPPTNGIVRHDYHMRNPEWPSRGLNPALRDLPGLAPGQAAAAPLAFESPTASSLALVAQSTLLTPPRVFVVVMDSDWSPPCSIHSHPESCRELWVAIQTALVNISPQVFRPIVESMPRHD
ncbi:hypothetical protein PR048_010541 [Dryococelus australis]|uniref:Uncharacterized protein n=1 Tax=Dryococelus australis TaxID=614101 RepID=A0ABQ9I305_9NEOP|nr:hypothetical protein PR048_010541 [Dryococelus australis]